MINYMQDTICILTLPALFVMMAVQLFFTFKNKKNATQKKKPEKVLHRKPRRNSPVKKSAGEIPAPFNQTELPL